MSNNQEVTAQGGQENLPANPFAKIAGHPGSINAGAVAIEQERAIAEAQGQLILAKRFPRSTAASISEFLDTCKSPEFAEIAFYSVPNRGSGPSIRFAEEAARCYTNFEYGHRELSRDNGKSEVEVYAWDKEKNNRSIRQITVQHVMDTKNGPRKLTTEADIDNKIANVASKQIRGRILALMPKHMIAAGIAEAKRTLAGNNERPLRDRVIAMVQAFGRYGITNKHLEDHLGHSVDDTTLDELADLTGIYNAIKEGTPAGSFFGKDKEEKEPSEAQNAVAAAVNGAQAKQPEPQQKAEAKADKKGSSKQQPKADKKAEEKQAEPPAEKEQTATADEEDDVF